METQPFAPPKKKKKRTGGFITLLIIALLLFYAGYHAFNFLSDPIETERVTKGGAEKILSAEGLFFKTVIPVSNTRTEQFDTLVENGEKVAKGQRLAVAYTGKRLSEEHEALSGLQDDIARLTQAIEQSAAEADTGRLDTLLLEQLSSLDGALYEGVGAAYRKLETLRAYFCRRAVIYEGRQDAATALADLQRQLSALNTTVSGTVYNLTAEKPGYFSGIYDGMDSLTPEALRTIGADDFRKLMEKGLPSETPAGYVGGVVTDFKWHFAFCLSQAPDIVAGDSVTLRFPGVSDKPVTASVTRAVRVGDSLFLAVEGDGMMCELVPLRKEHAELILGSYSGLRVSSPALHYVGGQAGVYVRNGAKISFKNVTVLYDAGTSYIVRPDGGESPLSVTDEAVVAGLELYDGKLLT